MTKIKVENIGKAETPPNSEQSESDNEVAEPVETKTKKGPPQKLVSCPVCNKEMLQKTFRYYHSLKCKPTQVEPTPVPAKPEKIEVSFGVGRPTTKSEGIQRLISKAF